MNNSGKIASRLLSEADAFLSDLLKEEVRTTMVSDRREERGKIIAEIEKRDLCLWIDPEVAGGEQVLILDPAWITLLSGKLLGAEQAGDNEVTRDLLKKFTSELSAVLYRSLGSNDGEGPAGPSVALPADAGIEVLTRVKARARLKGAFYYLFTFEVKLEKGDPLRAQLLIGELTASAMAEPAGPDTEGTETAAAGKKGAGMEKGGYHRTAPADEPNGTGFTRIAAEDMGGSGEEEIVTGRHIEFEEFEDPSASSAIGEIRSMDLLRDVEMEVSVELGRIELPLGKVLALSKGSVIELERLAGEPVDILVNGHLIGYGEVVVIDEHFGVRISNLISTRQRITQMQ